MISRAAPFLIVVGCLWAIADACFGLEHSWILFIHRAFSPLFFSVALGAFVIHIGWCTLKRRRPTRALLCMQALIVIACGAPVIRSIVTTPARQQTSAGLYESPIRLLSFNALGFIDLSSQIIQEIERLAPDIVLLQEVNPELAQKIRASLSSSYPCQLLDPAPGSGGMATIARYPCSSIPHPTSGQWVGVPQITRIQMTNSQTILAVNLHALHPHAALEPTPRYGVLRELSHTITVRENSVADILSLIQQSAIPDVVMAGDLNATMRNSVYEKIRAASFSDSWLDLHSFIGGGTWPDRRFFGTELLSWLLRIDFVFHSPSLRVTSIERLSDSLGSDHRGLLVQLQ